MYQFIIVLCLVLISFNSQSKQISIDVISKAQEKISNVVVYLTPKEPIESSNVKEMAIMDQIDTQFMPHILAVQKNTQVRFPNSDSIKHHVYSFSAAKTFELQLYKDLQADPLMFSKSGVVELGCNVHDWMLGYIMVVDTPYFGKTDENGNLIIDVPDGEYQLSAWHPRIQDSIESLSIDVSVPMESKVDVILKQTLLPDLNQYEEGSEDFSDYE